MDTSRADNRRTSTTKAAKKARRWVSKAQVVDHLGVCDRTVTEMIYRGELTAYRLGPKMLRFDLDEVDALLVPVSEEHPKHWPGLDAGRGKSA